MRALCPVISCLFRDTQAGQTLGSHPIYLCAWWQALIRTVIPGWCLSLDAQCQSFFQYSGAWSTASHPQRWKLSLISKLNFACHYLLVPAQWIWRACESLNVWHFCTSLNLFVHRYFSGSILCCVLASLCLLRGFLKRSSWARHSPCEQRLYQRCAERKDCFMGLAENARF